MRIVECRIGEPNASVIRHSSFVISRPMHLGLLCPELTGHLNPLTTLGRELQRRGHTVTVVARPDGEKKARAAGLAFSPIGEHEFPVGSVARTSAELGRLSGLKAVKFT